MTTCFMVILFVFNPYLQSYVFNIHARHAANFRSFMLLIFWIFHFFSRYLEKEIILWVCQDIPPPSNKVMKKNNILIFPKFFLGFMIEKISYFGHFFGKKSIFFKYFWSTTYPIIHWYLAKFSENLRKFRFLGDILW